MGCKVGSWRWIWKTDRVAGWFSPLRLWHSPSSKFTSQKSAVTSDYQFELKQVSLSERYVIRWIAKSWIWFS